MPERLPEPPPEVVQARAPRRVWTTATFLALLALLAAAACDLPKGKAAPQLFSLAELEALADGKQETFVPDHGVPGGLPVADYVTSDAAGYHLRLRNTWTEAYRSAYVTTEIWTGFDQVWVQPVYVPITGFVNGVVQKLKGDDMLWHPIFTVGPGSKFYSPFWQVFYFQVPDGTSPTQYTSARQVLDSGLLLEPIQGRVMALVPGDVVSTAMEKAAVDQSVGGPTPGHGWLDGRDAPFLDFGPDTFRWNDDLVVEETPLFVLVTRDADGALERLNVPTVAGTGPLYANRPVLVADLEYPHYGSYWRLYTVEVPPTARIFAPPALLGELGAIADGDGPPPELVGGPYGDTIMNAPSPTIFEPWLGRVALNVLPAPGKIVGCFNTIDQLDTLGAQLSDSCKWLDSQPAIEQAIAPELIQKTDITVTCPFVSYHDMPVTP
jgi:hypothetical protein